jgi:aldose 1-epimerase
MQFRRVIVRSIGKLDKTTVLRLIMQLSPSRPALRQHWSGRIAIGLLLLLAATFASRHAAAREASELRVECSTFGHMPDGTPVDVYTMSNARGMRVRVMTLGATLLSVQVPDRAGNVEHVTLHLDTLEDYLRGHPLFGSVVGRYANRIAGAGFALDGVQHDIERNAGAHHIHGGRNGFQKRIWDAAPVDSDGAVGVRLTLTSDDGDAGFPGTLQVAVTYQLDNENQLTLDYRASTDKPTVVNLTNHAYWNLAGAGSGNVLDQLLMINADHYLPADAQKIPTGEIRSVEGTVMDFTTPHQIGARIDRVEDENYDHCYVVNKLPGQSPALAARAADPASGRVLEVYTTKPGVHLYTAKGLNDRLGADGKQYGPYHGFCLETQHFPDSPNRANFPSPVLRPGETYHHVTIHKFSVQP